MNPIESLRSGIGVFAVLALFGGSPAAQAAISYGISAGGHAFAMGGIGEDENAQLRLQRARYSLWILTATRSGEYLADAQVAVTGPDSRPEFEGVLSGPWLLLELPPGTYAIQASSQGTIQRRTATVPPEGYDPAWEPAGSGPDFEPIDDARHALGGLDHSHRGVMFGQ